MRATPDSQFIGDNDEAIRDRRAALDAAIAARKPRPGTLHFHRPVQDEDDAMPLLGMDDAPPSESGDNIDAIAMRDGNAVAEILRASNTVPSRRIGPYRPGDPRNRAHREEDDPIAIEEPHSEEEVDELIDEDAATASPRRPGRGRGRRAARTNTHTEPLGQTVRIEPYKRSNLYITGHNMTGRSRWTEPEVHLPARIAL